MEVTEGGLKEIKQKPIASTTMDSRVRELFD
jgi:hypothetical protein